MCARARRWSLAFALGGALGAGCLSPPSGPSSRPNDSDDAGGAGRDGSTEPPVSLDRLGGSHRTFCAIRGEARHLYCWGENNRGQLGVGPDGGTLSPNPVRVMEADGVPLADVIQVEAGTHQTCALLGDRTIRCWGNDASGQLGDGPNQSDTTFANVTVQGIDDADSIATLGEHVCAVRSGGVLSCWGRDSAGQLGDLDGVDQAHLPQPAVDDDGQPIADAVHIGAGKYHTCVVRSGGDRRVACAGLNDAGQAGRSPKSPTDCYRTPMREVPHGEDVLRGATQVAANYKHACALVDSGAGAYCWGHPRCGQLGDGLDMSCATLEAECAEQPFSPPVAVAFPDSSDCRLVQIKLGFAFTCARCDDGRVFCWGHGGKGRLGNDSTANSSVPVEVVGLDDAVDLAVGEETGCALRSEADGEVVCWGDGEHGELGNGRAGEGEFSLVPTLVAGLP